MAYAKIPKLNDKTINISRRVVIDEEETLQQLSYAVSASFKGILRLSPNNLASLNQSVLSIRNEDITYRDSIDEDIGKQMIQVSDSDGVMVDLRFSRDAVGFDKLYVRGTLEVDDLSVFNGKNLDAFCISGRNFLPVTRDAQYISNCGKGRIEQFDYVVPYMKTDWFPSEKEKERLLEEAEDSSDNTDVFTEDGKRKPDAPERSSIVVSLSADTERHFTQRNAKELIREVIFDNLLGLKMLPTGSVHFIPVTMEQYKALCHVGENFEGGENRPRPNIFRYGKGELTDPIVRDFLLCDGSVYYTRDFPELAKIINGSRVDVERIVTDIEDSSKKVKRLLNYSNDIFGMNNITTDEYGNEFRDNDCIKTFRVPDLRHRFIRSVALGKNNIGLVKGTTGIYSPDCRPEKGEGMKDFNNHVHHTAYATYDIKFGNCTNNRVSSYSPAVEGSSLTDKPRVQVLSSNTWKYYKPNGENYGLYQYHEGYIFTGNQPCYQGSRRRWDNPSAPSNYIFAVPEGFDANKAETLITKNNMCGRTSMNVTSFDASDVFSTKNPNLEITEERDYYGGENAPEYIACLPLIKI